MLPHGAHRRRTVDRNPGPAAFQPAGYRSGPPPIFAKPCAMSGPEHRRLPAGAGRRAWWGRGAVAYGVNTPDEKEIKKRKSRLASRAALTGSAVMTLGVRINCMNSLCTSPVV